VQPGDSRSRFSPAARWQAENRSSQGGPFGASSEAIKRTPRALDDGPGDSWPSDLIEDNRRGGILLAKGSP
jgi:hypothetical protein